MLIGLSSFQYIMHMSDLLIVLVCQPTYSAWLVCHSVGVSTDLCFDDVSICVKKGLLCMHNS